MSSDLFANFKAVVYLRRAVSTKYLNRLMKKVLGAAPAAWNIPKPGWATSGDFGEICDNSVPISRGLGNYVCR